MNKVKATYRRLLKNTTFNNHRYLYKNFKLNNNLTGLVGSRGAGKTTMLLQYIKENNIIDSSIYVSIDNIYFLQNKLIDFVDKLYELDGIRNFFFDEIHKYPNWNQELKNIYDSYPDIKVVFSGSSSIDLIRGTYDLSRRGTIYKINGMSFREYLMFNNIAKINPVSYSDIINGTSKLEEKLEKIDRIKGHFNEYLSKGYYPFLLEDSETYYQKLINTIEKIIYEDISNYYKLKTENLIYFKKIISYMATIPPSNLSINSIAKNIGLDNKTVQHYLTILNETGLVNLIFKNQSGSNLLKSTQKMFLNNSDIYNAIAEAIGFEKEIGTIREIFFINMITNSERQIFYSNVGDYEIEGIKFEIGGKKKSKKQIKDDLSNSFLVKDDIIYYEKNVIPLIYFGFLY